MKCGLVRSCGCLAKETSKNIGKRSKKYNTYDLSGEYGIGYDSKSNYFYFDIEDYDKIKDINWFIKANKYVEGRCGDNSQTSIHRVIMDNPSCHIDHINHNPQDNRKCNLRLVTREQNQANTKLRTDNTSGTKGVYFSNTRNCWIACIQANHKQFSKGFVNKEDAINYRKYLEEKYQKEYSYKNSMKEGEKYNADASR